MAFASDRAKTGEPAIGTLTARSQRLVEAYVAGLDYDLHDDAPIFRTKGFKPTGKWLARVSRFHYTKTC